MCAIFLKHHVPPALNKVYTSQYAFTVRIRKNCCWIPFMVWWTPAIGLWAPVFTLKCALIFYLWRCQNDVRMSLLLHSHNFTDNINIVNNNVLQWNICFLLLYVFQSFHFSDGQSPHLQGMDKMCHFVWPG